MASSVDSARLEKAVEAVTETALFCGSPPMTAVETGLLMVAEYAAAANTPRLLISQKDEIFLAGYFLHQPCTLSTLSHLDRRNALMERERRRWQ